MSGWIGKIALIAAMAIGLGLPSNFSWAQQRAAPSNPQQQASPQPAPQGQQGQQGQTSDNLFGFLHDAGTVAGALSVCSPEAYTAVRLCSILIVSHWQALGNTMPRDQARMSERIEQTWREAAGHARNLQAGANAPTDCETLQRAARALPFWQTCDSARRLQAALEERNRPAQAGQVSPSQTPARPSVQGGQTRPPPRTEPLQIQ